MSDVDAAPKCWKDGCPALSNGSCAEGHEALEACPWYCINPPEGIEFDDDPRDESILVDSDEFQIALPKGAALLPQDLDALMLARPIRLIAMVGDRESGKTTLICSIYENFLKNRFKDLVFCGSSTLVGFEERSHESRVASGRDNPETAHTSLAEGLHFYHLSMASRIESSGCVDLVISDRNGEAFASVRDKPATALEAEELRKADRIVICLDGKRVSQLESRGFTMPSVRNLLRAFIDSGAVTANSDIQIVLTKMDWVGKAPDKVNLASQLEDYFSRLTRDFGARVGRLTYWKVAARDPENQTDSGLDALLQDWLNPEDSETQPAPLAGLRRCEFDRLLDRVGLESLP